MARACLQELAAGKLPDSDGAAGLARGGQLAIRARGNAANRVSRARQIGEFYVMRSSPELHLAITARGQEIARRIEDQGLHEIEMGDAGSLRARLTGQRRIDEP